MSLAAKISASLTVKVAKSTSSCMTYAAYLWKVSLFTGISSLNTMLPESFVLVAEVTLSARMLSREVLPAPDEPMINVAWPGHAYPDTPLTILSDLVFLCFGWAAISYLFAGM